MTTFGKSIVPAWMMEKVSPNFYWSEFFVTNQAGGRLGLIRDFLALPAVQQATYKRNIQSLALQLEMVRRKFGNRAIAISSGWRSKRINDLVSIATQSAHLSGKAADFNIAGVAPNVAQGVLDPIWQGGMEFAPTWTHLDIGSKRRFYP